MVRPGPIERIRVRWSERVGAVRARALPTHYQRLGRVVLVRWPDELRDAYGWLAEELARELGVETVGRIRGPAEGARREPQVEILRGASTETEVVEDGLRFRFDAARVLYSRGNRTERARIARVGAPGEAVLDMFAGIGYFALPIARHGRPARVVAIEENPTAFDYLQQNIELNGLADRVEPLRGDNRSVVPGTGRFDRVVLGFLPDARPWIRTAVKALRPGGGTLHVHWIEGARVPIVDAETALRASLEQAGDDVAELAVRPVKAYGPGRVHLVADMRVVPGPRYVEDPTGVGRPAPAGRFGA